jgi:hypothetical protein
MNTDSCDMIRVADDDAVHEGAPGSFCIETLESGQRVMWHKLPDGNGGLLRLRPVVSGDAHPSWEWDGNEEKPTLSPSVHLPGRWHGWFRAGRMVSC